MPLSGNIKEKTPISRAMDDCFTTYAINGASPTPVRRAPAAPIRPGMKLGVAAGGMAVVILVLSLLGYDLWREREGALEEARQRTASIARAVEQHAAQAFRSVDLTLAIMTDLIATQIPTPRPFDPEVRAMLRRYLAAARHIRSIFILDQAGNLVHASDGAPDRPIVLPEGDFVAALRDFRDAGLHIGRPFRDSDDGPWSIPVSDRLTHADGTFAGAAVAMIDPDYFLEFYQSIDLDE